jgi:plastocyanin
MGPRLCALSALAFAAFAMPASAETIRVNVDKLVYSPAKVSAHVGDTIEWTNADILLHTATARTKDFDVNLPVKGAGRVTLKKAGEIEYFCKIHPNMVGHISVAE